MQRATWLLSFAADPYEPRARQIVHAPLRPRAITAFASFATASFMPNAFFGLLTAFTLAVALLADALLLPALLLLGVREPGVEVAPLPAAAE